MADHGFGFGQERKCVEERERFKGPIGIFPFFPDWLVFKIKKKWIILRDYFHFALQNKWAYIMCHIEDNMRKFRPYLNLKKLGAKWKHFLWESFFSRLDIIMGREKKILILTIWGKFSNKEKLDFNFLPNWEENVSREKLFDSFYSVIVFLFILFIIFSQNFPRFK